MEMRMKKTIIALMLLAPALSNAQVAENEQGAKEIFANVTEVPYVETATATKLVPNKAWHGTRVLKLKDGACLKVERSEFRLVKAGGGAERPEFKEAKTVVACPQ